MRGQNRLKGSRLLNSCKAVWEQGKFPLSMGATFGAITCTLVGVAFGTGYSSVVLMVSIGGSFLLVPVLIVGISHYLDS